MVPSGKGLTHHHTRRSIGQVQNRPAPVSWSSWLLAADPSAQSALSAGSMALPLPPDLGFQDRLQHLPHAGPQGSPRPTPSVRAQHPASMEPGPGGSVGNVTGATAGTQAWARELRRPRHPTCRIGICADTGTSCGQAGGLMGNTQLDAPWKFPWPRGGNHFL